MPVFRVVFWLASRRPRYKERIFGTLCDGASFRKLAGLVELKYLHLAFKFLAKYFHIYR